jgi:hypothetical protein
MVYPHYVLKLIQDEHHRELIAQNSLNRQLKRRKDPLLTPWATRLARELLDNLRITFGFNWRNTKPIKTTQIGYEFNECQSTPDCQSC